MDMDMGEIWFCAVRDEQGMETLEELNREVFRGEKELYVGNVGEGERCLKS